MDKEQIRELRDDLAVSKKLDSLATSIEHLAEKVGNLTDTHLKIIYWLLVLVSLSLAGVRGAEAIREFRSPLISHQEK